MTLEFWIARMGLLYLYFDHSMIMGFPGGSDGKESTCNAGDLGSVPELGRSPGEGNGYPLQYSSLKNPTDGGACQATVHGVTKSRTGLRHFPKIKNALELKRK